MPTSKLKKSKTQKASSVKKTKTGLNIRVVKKKKVTPKKTVKTKKIDKKVEKSTRKRPILRKKAKKVEKIEKEKVELSNSEIPVTREEALIIYEEVEHNKKMIMWSGVTFFMILIVFIWFVGLKQTIIKSNVTLEKKSAATLWDEKSNALDSQISEMNSSLEKISNFADESKSNLDNLEKEEITISADPVEKENTTDKNDNSEENNDSNLTDKEIEELEKLIKELKERKNN